MKNKFHDGYPILFSILHMCANIHQNQTNNKNIFLLVWSVPLKVQNPKKNFFI